MDLYKYGIRFFTSDTRDMGAFIPIFQGWIQRQALEKHLLIDVHDYSHVPQGPGILLVSHEANINIDESGGKRSLVYIRKQPTTLTEIVAAARAAANLLAEEQEMKFDFTNLEIFSNDRLLGPNDKAAAASLQSTITTALGSEATVAVKPVDPRERLTFTVRLSS